MSTWKYLLRRLKNRKASRGSRPRPGALRCALNLETLEERTVPTVTVTAGIVTVAGTAAADQFTIALKDAQTVRVTDNGAATDVPLADVQRIVVLGGSGDDTLTLDAGNGLVAKQGGLPVRFVGGKGHDTLTLTGNPGTAVNETLTLGDTNSDDGTLTATAGAASVSVRFQQVSAVVDVMTADSLTINTNEQNNHVQVLDGPTVGGVPTTVVQGMDRSDVNDAVEDHHSGHDGQGGAEPGDDKGGQTEPGDDKGGKAPAGDDKGGQTQPADDKGGQAQSGGGDDHDVAEDHADDFEDRAREAFVPVTFANKGTVTINTGAGDDFVVLNNPHPAAGLGRLVVDGQDGAEEVLRRTDLPGVDVQLKNNERVDDKNEEIYIEDLYEQRLGRLAAQPEVEFWRSVLRGPDGVARVADGIEHSTEARARVVRDWYRHYLNREAQGGEELYWVGLMQAGQTEEQALSGLLASPEFQQRAHNEVALGDDNDKFVRLLYRVLLNREAGQAEVDGWKQALAAVGRQNVGLGFLTSHEFRRNVVGAFYGSMLHRAGDDQGLDFWASSGLDLSHIRGDFEKSPEFIFHG